MCQVLHGRYQTLPSLLHRANLPIHVYSTTVHSNRSAYRVQLNTRFLWLQELWIFWNLKGMYGLKEAAILAYEQLQKHLALYGYVPFKHTAGMWCHITHPNTFTLAIDAFVSITSTKMMKTFFFQHSKTPLQTTGMVIRWPNEQLNVWKWLSRHLHAWLCPKSSSKIHACPALYSTTGSMCMDNACIWKINSILNTFLYYAHSVDPTILPTLNEISNQPTKSTEKKQWNQADNLCTFYTCILRLLYILMPLIWFFPMLPTWCYFMLGVAVPHSVLSLTFLHLSLQPSSQMVLFVY